MSKAAVCILSLKCYLHIGPSSLFVRLLFFEKNTPASVPLLRAGVQVHLTLSCLISDHFIFLSSCSLVAIFLSQVWESATGSPLLSSAGSDEGQGASVFKLHGDMPQAQRTANFLRFTQVIDMVTYTEYLRTVLMTLMVLQTDLRFTQSRCMVVCDAFTNSSQFILYCAVFWHVRRRAHATYKFKRT